MFHTDDSMTIDDINKVAKGIWLYLAGKGCIFLYLYLHLKKLAPGGI